VGYLRLVVAFSALRMNVWCHWWIEFLIAAKMDTMNGYFWSDLRPGDGQEIEFFELPDVWHRGTYYDGGLDVIVEWHDGDEWEIEEYGPSLFPKWRKLNITNMPPEPL
jgi:hypothetical protein